MRVFQKGDESEILQFANPFNESSSENKGQKISRYLKWVCYNLERSASEEEYIAHLEMAIKH